MRTGDPVRMDPEGFARIAGRGADPIDLGGCRVHPAEVEAVLVGSDPVADAAVFAQGAPPGAMKKVRRADGQGEDPPP